MQRKHVTGILILVALLLATVGTAIAQGPNEKGPEASAPSRVDGPLLGPVVNGTLDAGDPTFNRPVATSTVTPDCASAWVLSAIGTAVYYEAYAFHVTDTSPIQIEVTAGGTTILDTWLAVYCNPFNPATPLANGVASDDDDGANALSAITLANNVTLTPGNTYWAVITTFDNGVTGDYELTFSDNVVMDPLAVTLASFDAAAQGDHVLVSWETVSELDNAGFTLYRSATSDGERTRVAFVPSQAPGGTGGATYTFTDPAITAGETYLYWLEAMDLSGATTLHGPVSVTLQTPTAVTLGGLSADAGANRSLLAVPVAAALVALAAGYVLRRR